MAKRVGPVKAAGTAMICMLVLSGCVQVNAAPASLETTEPPPPSQQVTEPPVDGGQYGSVVELRDAMVKAGLACPQWDDDDPMVELMSRADCSENTLIATYSSRADLQKQMKIYRTLGETMEVTVLVGVNWTINSPLADRVQDKLGGYLYKSTGKR